MKPGNVDLEGVATKYSTQTALADALGVTKGTVSKYLKRDDWPVRRRAPWSIADLQVIQNWRVSLQEDRSEKAKPDPSPSARGLAEKKAAADVAFKAHRARREKVAADLAEGAVVKRDLLEAAVASVTRMYRTQLDELVASLPQRLVGDRVKNRKVLEAWRRECCERLSSQETLALELNEGDL